MKKTDQKLPLGMTQNTAAALAYSGIWLTGLLFFFLEKKNKFVRFHALQSMLVFGSLTVIMFISSAGLNLSAFPFTIILLPLLLLLRLIYPLLGIGCFIVWLVCIVKAYQGEEFQLPIIGRFAKENIKNN